MFDKIKFQKFVTNKEFLADSYTAFNNKIGLTANGQFLTQAKEVVLDFPYKDCVLQGGQTKDDQKRQEIFWNETLAPDEIDRLFEPKVLTNWKRYDRNGIHKVERNSLDDHLIIKGNNLITLHSIKKIYRSKIKLIYIDPPYNTRSKANTFLYNNTFKRSTWLTFMKNRLEVSKELLRDDGVICIAIDDHEYAHLKVLCDEIFSENNYIGSSVIRSFPGGRTNQKFFSVTHEYCLFYAKNINSTKFYELPKTDKQLELYNREDNTGKFKFKGFKRTSGISTPKERPNSEFSLYYSISKKNIIAVGGDRTNDYNSLYKPKSILMLDNTDCVKEYIPDVFFKEFGHEIIEILPIDKSGKRCVWKWSNRRKILKSVKEGEFNIIKNKDGNYTIQIKDRIKKTFKPQSIWYGAKYGAGTYGTTLLNDLFNDKDIFSFPKSIHTVKDTIRIFSKPGSNDIVLDFFAGSGTTGHAVLELNKEDGGNRKFILCEQMDYINSVTSQRIQKVIKENQSGFFIYCELAEHSEIYRKMISDADDSIANALWEELKNSIYISYKIDFQKVSTEEFQELTLDEKKGVLTGLLDKNMLYIPYSERNNCDYEIKEIDKKLTEQFYNQ